MEALLLDACGCSFDPLSPTDVVHDLERDQNSVFSFCAQRSSFLSYERSSKAACYPLRFTLFFFALDRA